ncbi:MAG: prepilin-type N-terminal cleavage/methylation domain-containing protein [bacterium]|nr:prepilin-type N-terminal cleavage/methylation domain-containing protein [bacterium]
MRKKGLTLVEVLVTLAILSLIILTLISSTIFIVKSSEEVSKSHIVKSKLTYYYFDLAFLPFFLTNAIYDPSDNQGLYKYEKSARHQLELSKGSIGRIYTADHIRDPNLRATEMFKELRKKLQNDKDIKNWGIEIESLEIRLSNKRVSSIVVEKKDDSKKVKNFELIATLLWFNVTVKYKTKDGRILTLNMELPLINNVNSPNILPEGYDELPPYDEPPPEDNQTTIPPDYDNTTSYPSNNTTYTDKNYETSTTSNPAGPSHTLTTI